MPSSCTDAESRPAGCRMLMSAGRSAAQALLHGNRSRAADAPHLPRQIPRAAAPWQWSSPRAAAPPASRAARQTPMQHEVALQYMNRSFASSLRKIRSKLNAAQAGPYPQATCCKAQLPRCHLEDRQYASISGYSESQHYLHNLVPPNKSNTFPLPGQSPCQQGSRLLSRLALA